jgi:hypothetical protein
MNQTSTRPIPPLPGGGSWTFDDIAWKWVSNDPAPVEEQPAEQPAVTEQTNDEA